MICDYLKWIVDPDYVNANIFTFLSVIASDEERMTSHYHDFLF